MAVLESASRRALVGFVVAGAVVTAGLLVSPSAMAAVLESLVGDPFWFGLTVAGLYAVRPLLAWPTTPLAVVVGYGYGIALGVPIALLGVVATVIPVFLAVRWFAVDDAVDAADASADANAPSRSDGTLLERTLERTGTVVTRYYETAGPLRGVTASRLAPIPSDVATCAAAVSGVSLRHFVVGTALGELPWTIAAVVVGASAATVTTGGLGELGLTLSIACGLAAALVLGGPVYRAVQTRIRGRTSTHT